MNACLATTVLLILSAAPAPDAPDDRERVPASPLKQSIDGIWKDAEIASDAKYQTAIAVPVEIDALAPRDMREMITEWPEPRNLRNWPQRMLVLFQEKRISVSWSGEIGQGLNDKEARERFLAELEKRGYRPVKGEEGSHATYARRPGETELVVSFDAHDYTGSQTYLAGVGFTWTARRPYAAAVPTLRELLAVLPAWAKPKYLDDKFYTSLGEEPITSLNSGTDFHVDFERPVVDKLIKSLEASGFEYRQEQSPGRDGKTQKTWYRFTDVTYAHVITSADGKQLRFFCQKPQHKGEPLTVKPPPLHPSLRLPREKRPVLAFDDLPFANEDLKQQTKLFHDWAESLAQKDWHVQPFTDRRYSSDPRYSATWQSNLVKSYAYTPKDRPHHSITMGIDGKQIDGKDELQNLYVGGITAPREGWGASVAYNVRLSPDGEMKGTLTGTAAYATEKSGFSFDQYSGEKRVPLTQRWVSINVNETKTSSYRYYSQTPGLDLKASLRMLCGTPEDLRDAVLADIELLRKQVAPDLDQAKGLVYYDLTDVRSDNPPMEEPGDRHPPTAATKQAILAQVEQQLAAQEAAVRENFREIHAAVHEALPLDKVADELLPGWQK